VAPSLINVDVLPGDDMSPDAIRGGATSLRAVGDKAFTDSSDVVKTWSGIAHPYVAPESEQLVAAMNPVKTSATTFDQNLCAAADSLDTFAEAVRAIKKTCDGIRADAKLLLGQIDANGKVGSGGIGPGTDWWHDPVTFHKNEALIAAVAAQAALLKTAERACAGAIEGLAGGGQRGENGGPGFATAPTVEDPPWGHVETVQQVLAEAEQEGPTQQQGESQQALEALSGFVSLVGFDTSHFAVTAGHPTGRLFGHWSVHNIVTNLESIGQAVFAHPVKTGTGLFKDFTAWDDWSDHPGYAFGRVEANVLLLGLSFLKVGSLARVGSAGREAAEAAGAGAKAASEAENAAAAASRLARLAEIGQQVGTKTTVATVDGLKNLARTAKLDTAWTKTLDRLDHTIKALHHDIDVEKASTKHPEVPGTHDVPVGEHHPEHAASRAGSEVSDDHSGRGHDSSSDGPSPDHPTSDPSDSDHHGDGTQPSSAPDTQHLDAHKPQGQHRFSDVNSSKVDALHHVVHRGFAFKTKSAFEGPSLADTRVVLQPRHLDALHHRNALARVEHVDPKDLAVKNVDNTLEKLEKQATTPAELRRVRALADATTHEYNTNRKLHEVSERMGTEAGKAFHRSRGEELIAGDHDRPGRRNELDTVGINKARTVLDVVEEKGGTAGLGTRKLNGVEVEQGSTAYLNKMLHLDPELTDHFRRNPDDVRRLIDGTMELRYHVLYATPDGKIWVERMKLNPDELHLEDLLPPAPPAPAPVQPVPVVQHR
jgi:hypothetical protein